MSTQRPNASLWRRTRAAVLAGAIALGAILAPAGAAASVDAGVAFDTSASDGTAGAGTPFTWEGDSLADATAIVSTGGGELAMHADPAADSAVVARIPNGTVVALRIDETDTVEAGATRWWPVSFDGQAGWVSGNSLVSSGGLPAGTTPFTFDGGALADATATVSAEGGLRLRAEPSATAASLATIPDGAVVDLRIDETDTVYDPDGITRWWPVAYDGSEGWVSGYFLSEGSGPAPATATTTPVPTATATPRAPFTFDGGQLAGATAIAAGDGQNVNVRAEPSATAEIVARAPDGSVVSLRIDAVDSVPDADGLTRWWPVAVDGVEGWISGDYLADSASTGEPGAPGTVSLFPAGSTALVQTQSGSGARLRAAAGMDAEQIGSVPERAEVTIVSGPASQENSQNGWFEVRYGDQTGYVDGDLLVLLATPVPTAPPATTPAVTATATQPPTQVAPTQTPTADDDETPTAGATTPAAATTPDATTTPTATATGTATLTPAPTQTPAQSGSSQFILPVEGAVQTQGFGCSSLGFYPYNPDWGCGVHDGIDFAAPTGTPIRAVADGTVVTAGWCDCGLGYYVEIDHGNNLHTIYGHMASQPYVSVGQQVTQGQTIGPVGSTGLSTGPHVHFMVQVNGVSQDPSRYLP